jgi:hypothetical protein
MIPITINNIPNNSGPSEIIPIPTYRNGRAGRESHPTHKKIGIIPYTIRVNAYSLMTFIISILLPYSSKCPSYPSVALIALLYCMLFIWQGKNIPLLYWGQRGRMVLYKLKLG